MKEAITIFRKDLRHLWPRIVPVWCLAAAVGWQDARLSGGLLRNAAWSLWLLSWVYVATAAVHEEALPGHRQYWLTRPIGWGRLLLSKMLFLVVCGSLPMLVAETVALAVNGISPLRHMGVLLNLAVLVTGGVSLLVAALAAVTEDLVQFLWGFGALVGMGIIALMATEGHPSWGTVEWLRGAGLLLVLVPMASAGLLLAYARRRTMVSRYVLGCGVALAAAGVPTEFWHAGWMLEGRFGARQMRQDEVTLTLDPTARVPLTAAEIPYFPAMRETGINLPIVVSGLPEGVTAVSERISVEIDAGGGKQWRGSWVVTGGMVGGDSREDRHVIRGNGPYWQYVNVDRAFYEAVKGRPVSLHTSVALTLLGNRQRSSVAESGETRHLPGEGVCTSSPKGPLGYHILFCEWPGRAPERTYVEAVMVRTGRTVKSQLARRQANLYAIDGALWDGGSAIFSSPAELAGMTLETWQAVSHFDRALDVPEIVLGNYAIRRITDTP